MGDTRIITYRAGTSPGHPEPGNTEANEFGKQKPKIKGGTFKPPLMEITFFEVFPASISVIF